MRACISTTLAICGFVLVVVKYAITFCSFQRSGDKPSNPALDIFFLGLSFDTGLGVGFCGVFEEGVNGGFFFERRFWGARQGGGDISAMPGVTCRQSVPFASRFHMSAIIVWI
jgi:hypothetical protein